jgi:hypothetical protein
VCSNQREITTHRLSKETVGLPDDLARHVRLGELLIVVGVVEELVCALGRDLEPVWGSRAQWVATAASEELTTSAL